MNIGDGCNGPDLFARMHQAHRQEVADSVGSSREAEAAGNVVELSTIGQEPVGAELESRLLATAAAALDGGFESVDELQKAVIGAIVEARYASHLPASEAEQITRTLEMTLSTDPNFGKEVDNMMIQAARRLGRRQND